MNNCKYCSQPTQGQVCMATICQNKKKRRHRLDNLDHYHKIEKEERQRNYSSRKDKALKRAKKRYYSNDLGDIVALMFQHVRSRARKSSINFDIDKEFLTELFKAQNNTCALTGITFQYYDNNDNLCHRRPFAPSLDRIDCKKGYTKDNVRLVCIIVNFALGEFGDQAFEKMCMSYANEHSPR